ncbi:MAG TPA: hypothetical protein VKX17_21565 [Planctomycetota bacterium]|nr:hypothetical protein [Planctomycetota bacterium]
MKPLTPVCAKCQSLLDGTAVFLKNGTYMCPACYQRAFPIKTSEKPRRIDISTNGFLAVAAVIGLFYAGYKVVQFVMDYNRNEARLAQEAEEAAERRYREDAQAAEARHKAAELGQKAAESARQSKLDAVKLAAEERAKEHERQLAETERKEKEEAALHAHEAEHQRIEENAKAAESVRARASELDSLANKLADARKSLSLAESDRALAERKSAIYQKGLSRANSIKAQLLAQYNAQFPGTGGDDVPKWRNPPGLQREIIAGRVPVVVDHSDEYRIQAAHFDAMLKEIQSNEDYLAAAKLESEKIDKATAAARAQIEEVNRRLDELKATPAERSAIAQAAVPRISMKTIVKKDGSLIKALSIIAADNQIRYTNEAGEWQLIDKADVKEIQ